MHKEDMVYVNTHIHTHTMAYNSDIKNEIMPFLVTWTDLEIVILSELIQKEKRQISYDITYMWHLKR